MSDEKTFAGIRVDGYGSRQYHEYKPQRPKEELEELFRAALAHPEVKAIRWDQYTPYFNDGDPCYFSVYEARFLLDVSGDDEGDYEDGYLTLSDTQVRGGRHSRYDYETRKWVETGEEFPIHPAYDALAGVNAVGSGEFDAALQEVFGDHVTVTVTRDGITVDDYDHD